MSEGEDKEEIMGRREKIWDGWGVSVEEDLSKEERKVRWRVREKAREERRRGKKVVYEGERIWIEGREWRWNEEEGEWMENEGE